MKIDSEHLEILAVIVEKGGLTEGADELGKSQPSVSRSMALLEKRIGMPLFEPGRRPLRPTELGASLARLGTRIRTANKDASLLVRRFRQGLAGRLRVGGSPIFTDGVVATMIAEFQSRHSDVHIDQSYGYLDALEAGLKNGGLDIAILPLHPRQVPPERLDRDQAVDEHVASEVDVGHPAGAQPGDEPIAARDRLADQRIAHALQHVAIGGARLLRRAVAPTTLGTDLHPHGV